MDEQVIKSGIQRGKEQNEGYVSDINLINAMLWRINLSISFQMEERQSGESAKFFYYLCRKFTFAIDKKLDKDRQEYSDTFISFEGRMVMLPRDVFSVRSHAHCKLQMTAGVTFRCHYPEKQRYAAQVIVHKMIRGGSGR